VEKEKHATENKVTEESGNYSSQDSFLRQFSVLWKVAVIPECPEWK